MGYWTVLCFLNFLNFVFNAPDPFYTVHLDKHTFEEALKSCESDHSHLTNMATQKEITKILKAIEDKGDKKQTLFWIGLKKNKTLCVQTNDPLMGFSWTTESSGDFASNKWNNEPQATCTQALCGLLLVKYGNSTVDSWHLDSSSCKQKHPFICKHEGLGEKQPCPKPIINGSLDIMQKNTDPYTLHVTCNAKDTLTLTCSKTTRKWELVENKETNIANLCQECQVGYKKDAYGNCVDVNECEERHTCQHQCINTEGSYNCTCPDGMVGDSKTCEKTVSLPKSSSGFTDFRDKPTPPSREKDPESTSKSFVKGPGDQSNIIIPVIIALLIFVVLVVIVVGIVKCCLIRRSKKRAKKRQKASKDSMALNGSDSMEKINEKEAT